MTERREVLEAGPGEVTAVLRDNVAVIPIEDPDMIGSIIVPEEAKQRVDKGVVKYRGPESKEVRVGDVVLFSGYSGTKVSIVGEGVLIIVPERDIHAILPDEMIRVFAEPQIMDCLNGAEEAMLREFDPTNTPGMEEIERDRRRAIVKRAFEVARSRVENYTFSEGLEF